MVAESGDRASRRWVALLAAAALTIGGGACGSDGDGDGGGAEATPGTGVGVEGEIRSLHERFIDSVHGADYEAACGMLTAAAQKQVAPNGDCAETVAKVFAKTPPNGDRPRIVKLTVDGRKATGRTKTSANVGSQPVEFVKQGDAWRIAKP